MAIDNNIQVDVTLSGSHDTSVRPQAGDSSVTVALGQQAVAVNQLAGSSVTIGQEGQTINVGMAGVQGPASNSIYAQGQDGNVQYNRLGYVSGADTFLFFPETDEVMLSGGNFTISGGTFKITGSSIETDDFSVKDINDTSKNLFHVDTINKKVTLTEDAEENEYYFGIGLDNPQEKLHMTGNLRVEGDIYLTGHIIPTASGVSNLGSPTNPFNELYLEGSSVNFVDANAKISATTEGFDFLVKEMQGNQEHIRKALSVVTGIDGGILKGVVGFAQAISGDASKLTGMHYSGIKHNGIFIEQNIPQNSDSLIIAYGETLPYTPRVLCSVVPPEGASDLYFTHVETITTENCTAVFSSKILQNNYKINCFISPRDL
jgi:hypothetical protein